MGFQHITFERREGVARLSLNKPPLNVLDIAMMREIEAIGTNAHELPMVYAALAETDDALRQSP